MLLQITGSVCQNDNIDSTVYNYLEVGAKYPLMCMTLKYLRGLFLLGENRFEAAEKRVVGGGRWAGGGAHK